MFYFAGVDFGSFFIDIENIGEEMLENHVGVFDFNSVILAFFSEENVLVVVFFN